MSSGGHDASLDVAAGLMTVPRLDGSQAIRALHYDPSMIPGHIVSNMLTHEGMHWVQAQGTTVGMFTRLLQYQRLRLVLALRGHIPKRSWNDVVRRREKRELVSLGKSFVASFPEDLSALNTGFLGLLSSWHELLLLEKFLESPGRIDDSKHRARQTLYRAMLALMDLNPRAEDYVSDVSGLSVDLSRIRPETDFGDIMSTRAVLELGACLQEVLIMHCMDSGQIASASSNAVLKEAYSRFDNGSERGMSSAFAWPCFSDLTERYGIQRAAIGLSIACDVALNPPLPPVDWVNESLAVLEHLLPGFRFPFVVRALSQCSDVPSAPLEDSAVADFARSLAERAKMPLSSIYDEHPVAALAPGGADASICFARNFSEQCRFLSANNRHVLRSCLGTEGGSAQETGLWVPEVPMMYSIGEGIRFADDVMGGIRGYGPQSYLITSIEDLCISNDFLASRGWPSLGRLPQIPELSIVRDQIRDRIKLFLTADQFAPEILSDD